MKGLFKASLAVALLFALTPSISAQTPAANATGANPPPACVDNTPHEQKLVRVDSGVGLQVLDWGGADKPATMVLLTGLGDSAHVYDQFAFQFTDHFHVIGITRRGYPPSSQPAQGPAPAAGYDLDTRTRDDLAVLDALDIRKAIFVGHSIAASELSTLAVKYADRVDKLVYLDAFDLAKRFQLPEVPNIPYTDADNRSLPIFQAADERLENILRPVQASCLGVTFDEHGRITGSTTPAWLPVAIMQGVKTSAPTDWAKIEAPRLGIFDQPSIEARMPYYWYLDAADKKTFDQNWPDLVKW